MLPTILSDSQKMVQIYTKEELSVIGQVLKNYTGRDFFMAKLLKISNAKMIASAFTGVTNNSQVSTTRKYNTSIANDPPTLKKKLPRFVLMTQSIQLKFYKLLYPDLL